MEAARQARALAAEADAIDDLIMATMAMAPPLLHLKRTDEALAALEEALVQAEVQGRGTAEMALRNLHLQALAQTERVADGIRAGFKAIERAGQVGTVDHYVGFVAHVSTLYYQAGAHVDAWNMLESAERGLKGRGDKPEALAKVEALIEALRMDLGPERVKAVMAECEARRG